MILKEIIKHNGDMIVLEFEIKRKFLLKCIFYKSGGYAITPYKPYKNSYTTDYKLQDKFDKEYSKL